MLTRKQIEYTLAKSRWYLYAKDCWEHSMRMGGYSTADFYIVLGEKHIYFNGNLRPRIRYKKLTPELWTELTGLKFHPEPNRKGK